MQIITFDNAERQKRGRGQAFGERGLEVNMQSNYISEHFNYVATQERNGQKNGRKHGESEAERGNSWSREEFLDRSHVQTASFHQLGGRINQ